jgi:hypothetical protein
MRDPEPGYFECWAVFAGALGAEETFTLVSDVDDWADEQLQAGAKSAVLTEVYVRFHEHAEGLECECAQYETSHKPYVTYEPEEGQS